MRRADCADDTFADTGNDCFLGRATYESIEMRAHGHSRFDFHADAILSDTVNCRAAHRRIRRVDYFRINARANRF